MLEFLAFNNRQAVYPRGKVLGGCSTVNDMVYMRGDPKCFDEWASYGNEGWGSKDVLKYFIKAENNSIPYLVNSPLRGTSGPLSVSENPYKTPLGDAFLDAGKTLNYKIKDLNGEGGEGFMPIQLTVRDRERCSTSKAYLKPIRDRDNLHISMNSRVTKVLINRYKTAYGVRFVKDDKEHVVHANNEVILSAGSINSPQILMLSGVGPADDLKKLHIPVVTDLPVGQNLRDHVSHLGLPLTISKPGSYNILNFDEHDVFDYAKTRSGKLSAGSTHGTALLKSKYAKDDIPDIHLFLIASNTYFNKETLTAFGVNAEYYDAVYGNINQNETISILPANVRPHSVGYLKLNTTNPFDAPLINPKYFSDPSDLDVLVEAVKTVLAIVKTDAFKKFGIKLPSYNVPACSNLTKNSDDYWRCAIRQVPAQFLHATSTCKMGIDDEAVVDPRLLVYGVWGLRVIDASIMPRPTNANTNVPTIMIGEKGADLIKEDYGQYFE